MKIVQTELIDKYFGPKLLFLSIHILEENNQLTFLAIQDSSITDIVCPLVPWSQLTIRAYRASKSDPKV